MSEGSSKTTTNCSRCLDCERQASYDGHWYKCYGQTSWTTSSGIKRVIKEGGSPPRKAPEWCPHRQKIEG